VLDSIGIYLGKVSYYDVTPCTVETISIKRSILTPKMEVDFFETLVTANTNSCISQTIAIESLIDSIFTIKVRFDIK